MERNMEIEIVREKNKQEIVNIWKKEHEFLGIPFNSFIDKILKEERLFCIKENDKIISFGGYEIMKKNPQIRITKLCTLLEHRKKGLCKEIIKHIIEITKHLGLDYVVHCKKGAENNLFYEKYGELLESYPSKTMEINVYKLDISKFGFELQNTPQIVDDYCRPFALTSQFRFCGNPLRLDFYTFCDFGCKYCFARNLNGKLDFKMSYAKFSVVERIFKKAFDTNEESKDVVVELLRRKTPIHVGGMADPFQNIEFTMKLNYKLIALSNKYQVPLIFSTKTSYLPNEYYEILDPKLHAFQISLISKNDEYLKKYETNTPSATQRLEFLKLLKSKGFWVSIRLQPLIDLEEGIELAKEIDGIADYLTVEHLKLSIQNPIMKEMFKDKIKYFAKTATVQHLQLPKMLRIDNFTKITEVCKKTIVGCGDNDLHFLSQSRCCCGIDTIGGGFDNYLKYNLTYFSTMKEYENIDDLYAAKCSVNNMLNADVRCKGITDFKKYVNSYCSKNLEYLGNSPIKNKFFGYSISKSSGVERQQVCLFDFLND